MDMDIKKETQVEESDVTINNDKSKRSISSRWRKRVRKKVEICQFPDCYHTEATCSTIRSMSKQEETNIYLEQIRLFYPDFVSRKSLVMCKCHTNRDHDLLILPEHKNDFVEEYDKLNKRLAELEKEVEEKKKEATTLSSVFNEDQLRYITTGSVAKWSPDTLSISLSLLTLCSTYQYDKLLELPFFPLPTYRTVLRLSKRPEGFKGIDPIVVDRYRAKRELIHRVIEEQKEKTRVKNLANE